MSSLLFESCPFPRQTEQLIAWNALAQLVNYSPVRNLEWHRTATVSTLFKRAGLLTTHFHSQWQLGSVPAGRARCALLLQSVSISHWCHLGEMPCSRAVSRCTCLRYGGNVQYQFFSGMHSFLLALGIWKSYSFNHKYTSLSIRLSLSQNFILVF